jgi:molybdopterin/thiamine biosynthesis adenylyltransferase
MEKAVRRRLAVEAVEAWLGSLQGAARRLTVKELRSYPNRRITVGWRLMVGFSDCHRRVDLLLDHRFPRDAPRVALVDRPDFLTWPHVEQDGLLCLLPSGTAVSVANPGDVTKNILDKARRLIEDSAAGRNQDDFRAEFLSYWGWAATKGAPDFYSLIDLQRSTSSARVWRGQRCYLIGDCEEEIVLWLQHRFGANRFKNVRTEEAVLLRLDKPLLPSEFPSTAADVLTIAQSRSVDGAKVLSELATLSPNGIVVVFASSTRNGVCLAGVTIPPPRAMLAPGQRRHDPLTRGFRPSRVPKEILVQRHFGTSSVRRSKVDRVDAAWIHGRDQDPRFRRLRDSTVAVLGVGSVGAPVVLLLAEAGIGRFVLVDAERLAAANVGRHPLGASSVGLYKAVALADRIKREYPHILAVNPQVQQWEEVADNAPGLLRSSDLIVSTMGDWTAEGGLNEWHLIHKRHPAMVYGWTEAHGCAGHAVAIAGRGGCFQCGFNEKGDQLLRVTKWPNGPTEKQEPACGAVYQPYGPVELGHIVAMIAELALKCLLDPPTQSTQRIWAGRRSLLETLHGDWTEEWVKIARDRIDGAFMEERLWPNSSSCIECVPTKRD